MKGYQLGLMTQIESLSTIYAYQRRLEEKIKILSTYLNSHITGSHNILLMSGYEMIHLSDNLGHIVPHDLLLCFSFPRLENKLASDIYCCFTVLSFMFGARLP